MKLEELQLLPFDLYTRNTLAAEAMGLISASVQRSLRVVDFGGRSGFLADFIPQQEVSIVDIREPETESDKQLQASGRFFVTSGLTTTLADQSYDVATSFETLEHVAPADRQQFLQEMWRVSKIGMIVSAPVDSPFNDTAERTLNAFFEQLKGVSHPWLIEHLENRPLPQGPVIAKYLKDLGAEVVAIPNNNTFLWTMLQYLSFAGDKHQLDIKKMYQLYNDNFKQFGDAQGPVYRHIYIALKPAYAQLVKDIQAQLVEIDLTNNQQRKILDVMLEELSKALATHEIFLQEKDVHIRNIESELELQEKQVKSLDQIIAQQTQVQAALETQRSQIQATVEQLKAEKGAVEANQQHALELKDTHIQNLEQELRQRATALEQNALRFGQLEGWQVDLNASLAKAVANIETKELEINQLVYKAEYLQTQLGKQERVIGELRSTIQDKDRHIGNIEPSYREMAKLSASPSFKILQFLGKIKHRVTHDYLMARNILKYEGFVAFLGSLGRYMTGRLKEPVAPPPGDLTPQQQYQVFLSKQPPFPLVKMKADMKQWTYQPQISIVVPVFNVKPEWLNACIESVRKQFYANWELCLYDDASTDAQTVACLKSWQGKDPRIKVGFGKQNLHISGATNEAIKLATGEFVGLLDNDDELTVDALYEVVKALNGNRDLGFIYSDEDKLEMDGSLSDPHFKPDFNLDLLLSINYISHFGVVRKDIGDQLGWFRKGFEGSQDYDLYLRVIERTSHIHHIQKVLYHWRKVPGSTAAVYAGKNYVDDASIRALTEYLQRNKIKGVVKKIENSAAFRVERTILEPELVSIIIPFKDKVELLKMCVPSILEKTTYKKYEILLVSNNSVEMATFDYVRLLTKANPNIRFLEHNQPFNYSEINNWAVKQAKGKYVLLMNNDIEVISGEWLTAMVEQVQRPEVGAVGAKLYYPNDTVQHAGVILGVGGVAGHAHKYLARGNVGYFGRASVIQQLSACTAACLLVKKEVYEKVSGLDEKNLKVAFNDVDFCLRVGQAGFKIIYTPFATLYHHESISRGQEDTPAKQERFQMETSYMRIKYGQSLKADPHYNPNLSMTKEDFSLAA